MGIPEFLYSVGLSAKKAYSLSRRRRLPCRVISIGNITVGGTGKTPAAIALAEEAKIRGYSPVILTRGYKGSAKGPCFVTKGDGPLLSAREAGDEPVLMAERLKGVPIIKGSDRYEAGMFALQNLDAQLSTPSSRLLFILDDGYQHWKLYRDRDILLIDSENPFGNRMLLPLGKLREPLRTIERADIVVLTKCKIPDGLQRKEIKSVIAEIKKYNAEAPVFLSGHSVVTARLRSGEEISPARLTGSRVFGFCALGNPRSFVNTIVSSGAVLSGMKTFRDHFEYAQPDIGNIRAEAEKAGSEWIVTTEKDMIKIRNLDLPENIIIIEIEFSVDKGFYNAVFDF
ncbi:MAG: tetraacyldisaccharide 4'-kinase [Nitrospirota bacterium]|nr:tetraacyldisaccharide 4'-kinase [Nitrospirota bacterium]